MAVGSHSLRAPAKSGQPFILGRMKVVLGYVVLVAGGIVSATVGAVAYRSVPPVGLIGCVVMVLFAAAFARAWLGWAGLGVYALTWLMVTSVWALEGSGGSVLIVQDGWGIGWLVGAAVAIVAVSVVPSRVLVGSYVTR